MCSFTKLRVVEPSRMVNLALLLLLFAAAAANDSAATFDLNNTNDDALQHINAFNMESVITLPVAPIADNTISPVPDTSRNGRAYKYSTSASSVTGPPAKARNLLTHSDEYVARNQRRCFDHRNLVACIKYKASKIVWMLATNSLGYFPNEYSRALVDDSRRIRIIQLGEPADEVAVFSEARSLQDDGELVSIFKFLKRAVETFGRNHGIQVRLSGETGARIVDSDVAEGRSRHDRKKKKWLIILPLIILMKIAHLKMTVVTLLLGVLGLNVLLVGGVAWLIHYLKFKTLCKIHPHLVQSHSHVYDSDPADYSAFVGSSFPGSHYGSASAGPHEINVGYKDWATSKAYHGHGQNYLDTISKRLQ